MKRNLAVSLLCILFAPSISHAQERVFSDFRKSVEVCSPEAYAMTQYGKVVPSMYTGAMEYEVSVYEYKDADFTIPISLRYQFDGFRPLQGSGTIGYGWSLNCGGAVTREVRGVRDEQMVAEGGVSGDACGGYYYFKRSGKEVTSDIVSIGSGLFSGGSVCLDKAVPAYFYGTRPSWIYLNGEYHQTSPGAYVNYETTPDIFHFALGGKQGDFIITGSNGECSAYSCDGAFGEYAITFYPALHYQKDNQSGISIRDGNGYEYVFGGSIDYVDYTDELGGDTEISIWPTTAWRLKEIIAPSGRKAVFEYGQPQIYTIADYHFPNTYVRGASGEDYNESVYRYLPAIESKTLFAVSRNLERILVDGHLIAEFKYTDRTQSESTVTSAPHESGTMTSKRLSTINIYNNNTEIIESATLSQNYAKSGSSIYRMFLSSISLLSDGKTSFSYDNNVTFPAFSNSVTDHWGFWNGKNSPSIPVSKLNSQDASLYNLNGEVRNAQYQYSKRGALTKITYPTGGTSTIEYEAHDASKRWDKSLSNPYGIPEVNSSGIIPGGCRVKRIVSSNGKQSWAKSYQYTGEDGNSSGVLNRMPRYVFATSFWTTGVAPSDERYNGMLITYDRGELVQPHDNHIGYSEVKVTNENDGSYEKHLFYTFSDYSDGYMYDAPVSPQKYEQAAKIDLNPHEIDTESGALSRCENLLLPPSVDYHYMRGRLKSVMSYDSSDVLKEKDEYIYTIKESSRLPVYYNAVLWFKKAYLTRQYPQMEKVLKTQYYDDGSSFVQQTNYRYNSFGQTSLIEIGDGNYSRRTYCRYSSEVQSSQGGSLLPAPVKDIVQTAIIGGQEYLKGTRSFIYSNTRSDEQIWPNPEPVYIYTYAFPAPLKVTDRSTVFSLGRMGMSTAQMFVYDRKHFRMLEYHAPGYDCTLEWDAAGKNITQLKANGMPYRYWWKDGVGLTKELSPSGRTRQYTYDARGRLSEIRNGRGELLQKFQYRLKSDTDTNPYPLLRSDNYIYSISHTAKDRSYQDVDMYDALGYLEQRHQVAYTGLTHVVTPLEYDSHRRNDARGYLPYVYSGQPSYRTNALPEQQAYYLKTYSDTCAVIIKEYEHRENGRLRSVTRAGRRYRNSSGAPAHKQTIQQSSCDDEDDAIPRLNYVDSVIIGGYYSAGELQKIRISDEDGKVHELFTDVFGKTVCERRAADNGQKADVYYIYDTRDSLTCIIQPEGAIRLPSGEGGFSLSSGYAKDYCFTYQRDNRGLVSFGRIPGEGGKAYIYDSSGRLILRTSAQKLKEGYWERCEYDSYNRPVRKSLVVSEMTPSELQSNVLSGAPMGYLIRTICPLEECEYYTSSDSLSYGLVRKRTFHEMPELSLGAVQGTLTRTDSYRYNDEGHVSRLEQSFSDGYRITYEYERDYIGNVLQCTETHAQGGSTVIEYLHKMGYDPRGRLLSEEESLDGEAFSKIKYTYDNLGRLIRKSYNDNLEESYILDIQNRWTRQSLTASATQDTLYRQRLDYSLSGKITEENILRRGYSPMFRRFSYDRLGRLTATSDGDRYIYDLNGNILEWALDDDTRRMYNYQGNHRSGYRYNLDGEVLSTWDEPLRIEYNICGYASSITDTLAFVTSRLRYFSDGVKYSSTNGKVNLVYRGRAIYDGSLIKEIATSAGRVFNEGGEANYLLYTHDYAGNTKVLTEPSSSSGSIKETDAYHPYGQTIYGPGISEYSDNRYRFAGKESVGTVIDFGPRLYSPATLSWYTPDSKAALYPHLSPYAYCGADPINYIDPDGNFLIPIFIKETVELAWDVGNVLVDGGVALYYNITGDIDKSKEWREILGSDAFAAVIPGMVGGGTKIIKLGEKIIQTTTKTSGRTSILRRSAIKLFGKKEGHEGHEVHHMLPVQFKNYFERLKINIDDIKHGAWWEKGSHRKKAREYNKKWEDFLKGKPTEPDIYEFEKKLEQEYKDIHRFIE